MREYYPSGKLKSEITYKNSQQNGPAKTYYANGNIESEANYRGGMLEGSYKTYYENGQVQTEVQNVWPETRHLQKLLP
ncbi:hypothetical protein GCM10028895_48130 [Pontibacter rugosus]